MRFAEGLITKVMNHKAHAVLAGIILFFAAANAIWVLQDKAPPMWDQAGYLEASEVLYHTLTEKGIGPFVNAFISILKIKAPLIAALPIPFYILFGNSYASALYVNIFFITLGGVYLYRLGRLMYGEKEALLSVFVLNTFPLIFGLSREFLVEYGLMVIVIMWVYYLLEADLLENGKHVYMLGSLLGLGMLMKVNFFLYIAFPSLFIIWKKIVRPGKINGTSLKNIFLVLLVGCIISGPWYVKNFFSVLHFALESGYTDIAKYYSMGEVFSIKTVLTYWTYLMNYGISVYYSILGIGLLLVLVAFRRRFMTDGNADTPLILLSGWLLLPFIILTFGVNKDYRYIAPLCPPLAALISAAMIKVLWSGYQRLIFFLLLCFHRSFGIMVNNPRRSFRNSYRHHFFDNFRHCFCRGTNSTGTGITTQCSEPAHNTFRFLSLFQRDRTIKRNQLFIPNNHILFSCKIHWNNRYLLYVDIKPYIKLGPVG